MAANRPPDQPPDLESANRPDLQHEERDVNVRSLTKVGIAFALLIVVSLFLVWFVFDWLLAPPAREAGVPPRAAQDARRLPPEPRLQVAPTLDLQQMLAAEQHILNGYAWLDNSRTFARIPVSVALDLVARRGLPARPSPPPPSADITVPSESGLGPIVQQAGGPLNPNRVFPPRQPLEIRGGGNPVNGRQAAGPPTPADRSLANPPEGLTK